MTSIINSNSTENAKLVAAESMSRVILPGTITLYYCIKKVVPAGCKCKVRDLPYWGRFLLGHICTYSGDGIWGVRVREWGADAL